MPKPRTTTAAIGAAALAAGTLLVPAPLTSVVVPITAGAVGMTMWTTWPTSRRAIPWAAVGIGLLSLAITLITERDAASPAPSAAAWILLEPALALVFVYLPVRWSPPKPAALAAGTTGMAVAVSIQRYMPPEPWWEDAAASALWLLPAIAVGLVAWYLRDLETRRHRAVADARRDQRFDLAADLHDFVAHDVSEIVAQHKRAVSSSRTATRNCNGRSTASNGQDYALYPQWIELSICFATKARTVPRSEDPQTSPHSSTASISAARSASD